MNLKIHLLFLIQLCSEALVSYKRYDILNNKTLWLSKENISLVLNYSFPESRCCNVCINSQMSEAEQRLFKLFVSVYSNVYFVNKKMHDCTDYLLIASEDYQIIRSVERIPTEISTTRILMLIDRKLEETSVLLNVVIYKYSSVNIIFQNGSYILSQNYLDPRTFKKINSVEELKRKTGAANLKSRELQVSTVFNPPYCFLNTTVDKTIKGIPAKVFLTNKKREMDGVELNLFLIIAEALNFTFIFRSPQGRYINGRKYNETSWDGGVIGQLWQKEVDISFSGIWLSLDNYEFSNITEPWTQIFIQLLVPRPKPQTSFWALTRPLSPTVWLVLGLTLSLKSASIYGKAWINPFVPRRFRNILVAFTEMMGSMLGTWLPRIVQLRLQFIFWELAGFIIVTAYCSSLAARLTNAEYEQRIDTIQQFIEKNLTWGRPLTYPQFKDFFDAEDKYAKHMPSRFVLDASNKDRTERILQGKHAVVGRVVGNVYYPDGYISEEALQTLRVMRETVAQFYTGFSVQPWILDPINTVMIRLKESGIVLYHLQHVIHRRAEAPLREVFVEHDKLDFNRAVVLDLSPLGAGFATLIFGLLFASIVFCTELRSTKGQRALVWTRKQLLKSTSERVFIKNDKKITRKLRLIYSRLRSAPVDIESTETPTARSEH